MYFESQLKRAPILLAAVAGTAFLFLLRRTLLRRRTARRYGCQPVAHSLSWDPFLGLDILPTAVRAAREHRLLEFSCQNYRRFGNTLKGRELLINFIITIEPENIKSILSTNFKDYGVGFRLATFAPLLGAGIFDSDGDHWAASRAMVRPNFARSQVADLTSFESLIQDMFALLPRDGQTVVDLQALFFRYTMDSATEFLFGQSVNTLRKTESELDFAEAFSYAQEAIITRGMLGPLAAFYRDSKADQCNAICRDFARQFVEEAVRSVESEKQASVEDKQEGRQKYIFSHALARNTSDKDQILDELMNVLLAGRDTTASMLSNMFFMLAKNPACWEKLRSEVANLDGRPPTYEELRNMKYVQYCMNECRSLPRRNLYSLLPSLILSVNPPFSSSPPSRCPSERTHGSL